MRSRAPSSLVLPLTVFLAACGAEAPAASSSDPASGAPTAAASGEPGLMDLVAGQLDTAHRYRLGTNPSLSVALPGGWGASQVPGGWQLISGRTVLRFGSGFNQVFVENGVLEPVGPDLEAIVAQIDRNNRFDLGSAEEVEIAGLPAVTMDADVIYENNEEGGASIVAVDQSSLFVPDLMIGRLVIIDLGTGPLFLIAYGPETAGRDALLQAVQPVVDSIQLDD